MIDEACWSEVHEWMRRSSTLLIKKLTRKDCNWAYDPGKRQSEVRIPHEIGVSGFFPVLRNLNAEKPHILESPLPTFWPRSGETRELNLKRYSNRGREMYFLGVPRDEFSGLTPASLLIGGVLHQPIDGIRHWFMVIDSASEESELLETVFDIKVDFHYGLFDPEDPLKAPTNGNRSTTANPT